MKLKLVLSALALFLVGCGEDCADRTNTGESDAISASGSQASVNHLAVGCDSAARTKVSHNYRKAFQASESKCRGPFRTRARKLHLRKAPHQIQERNLSL
jgi:hypothetical protein